MNDRTILLVEDNQSDEELTLLALQECKIANPLVIARDGAEALDYLFGRGKFEGRDSTAVPQVILLDLNLPKVSGLDVLREVRNHPTTALVPIVILTSSKEEQDVLSGYELRANSYIVKPVDFEQFTKVVQHLGMYWLLMNEAPNP